MSHIDSRKLTRWYDFQAPFYGFWRNDFDGELVRAVSAAVAAGEPRSVLDSGCGAGLFSIPVARLLPAARVVGVDLSAGMLKVASAAAARAGLDNVEFRQVDATALPFDERSFDTVVMAGLLPNVNDRTSVLREAGRVLQPAGRLYVVEFDRSRMGTAARLLFRAMILGYKLVSSVFRRFRFVESWNIESSTVDREELAALLEPAGLDLRGVEHRAGHAIYELAPSEGIA